jgi:hypothetical protein
MSTQKNGKIGLQSIQERLWSLLEFKARGRGTKWRISVQKLYSNILIQKRINFSSSIYLKESN